MRLSSIKLAGFKSFVEATKIPFPDQMTCVVGPNGCGKSNVIDAVRWVLGESSAKNLRGDAMTDVIFNGSTHRKPVSQASVELTFDNTQGRLPGTFAERNQIAIKRVVTRDGQSLYYLNGSKCRRRDITDIFLGTGLGPRSYAIIEQGMISRLIESKPQDLRIFIEEAAGVSKYKERRRETQTRIKSTRDNLERLLDVRQELNTQLTRLSSQAEAATQYRLLKAQERLLKGELAVLRWQSLHAKQLEKANQLAKLEAELAFLESAHGGHEDVLGALEAQVNIANDALTQAKNQQHKTQMDLARAEQQKLHLQEKQRNLQSQLAQLTQSTQETTELTRAQQEHVEILVEQVEEALETRLIQEAALDELQLEYEQQQVLFVEQESSILDAKSALQKSKEMLQQLHFNKQSNGQKYHLLEERLTQLQAEQYTQSQQDPSEQLDALKQSHKQQTEVLAKHQRQSQVLKEQLQSEQARRGELEAQLQKAEQQRHQVQTQVATLIQVLGDEPKEGSESFLAQLVVKQGYESVVEHALLGLDHLGVAAGAELNHVWPLKETAKEGSVATLIEAGIFPSLLNDVQWLADGGREHVDKHWVLAINADGVLFGENFTAAPKTGEGRLTQYASLRQLQSLEPSLQSDVEVLIESVSTCKLRIDEICALLELEKSAVHEVSQWIAANNSRISMVQEQVTQFQSRRSVLNTQVLDLESQLQVLDESLVEAEQLIFDAEEKVTSQTGSVQKEEEQFLEVKTTQHALQRRIQDAQAQLHECKLQEQRVSSDLALAKSKLAHLDEAQQTAAERIESVFEEQALNAEPLLELDVEIEALLALHQQCDEEIAAHNEAVTSAKQTLDEKQASLKDVSKQQMTLQTKRQALQLEEQGLLLKAQAALEPLAELNTTLKAVLETLKSDADAAKHQTQLSHVVSQLDELGAVNLAAIEEHQEALARQQYLDAQLDDLNAALDMLENAIKKIDRETKSRFKQTFEQVNSDLSELFPKVFGGGSAYLELTSDDMLESGVTIMARPPGKKNSTIHLLSGGEKALTALSLVFSIFRLNPAPFCMLDEVDAPLDDANVGRFCRLVEEMSQSVQFIYISHNKVAMEMAGRLTGVTMAEPGVSRMVAVDIEQAVQMAQT